LPKLPVRRAHSGYWSPAGQPRGLPRADMSKDELDVVACAVSEAFVLSVWRKAVRIGQPQPPITNWRVRCYYPAS